MSPPNTSATFRYVCNPSPVPSQPTPRQHEPYFHLSASLRTAPSPSHPQPTNLTFTYGDPVPICDIRGYSEQEFRLDTHGFTVLRHESAVRNWGDRETVEDLYFREVQGLVRQVLGERVRVVIYDWRLRRSLDGEEKEEGKGAGRVRYEQPLPTVHIGEKIQGLRMSRTSNA
ncbi:hypothetical protein IAQ61_008036 [Plenodomus lingam]|uniref:uncharacterized protein n=1 Tax=Leptosphaeria maculans TaxID=5022 RepID=UPI00331A920D|nr:hypothetical protein IAQ61_008036 [Plenodomus lingam]